MSYAIRTITTNTNELNFIKALINDILATDSNITLTTDMSTLESQYSDSNATPSFVFNIGNIYTITFTRYTAIRNATDEYYVTSSAAPGVQTDLYFNYNSKDASTTTTRSLKFMIINNTSCYNIRFGSYNNSNVKGSPNISYLGFRANTLSGRGYATGGNNILSSVYYMTDSNSTPIVKVNRLPYVYDENNENSVEIIKNKVFLTSGTSNYKICTTGIYDVSTVTKDITQVIDNKLYYSLDEHTIMEV